MKIKKITSNLIKIFCENIEVFNDSLGSAIINAPDRYTNLRKEKNISSEILQKIMSGEQIEILDNNGDWWPIQTKEGNRGYVHRSKIK